MAPARQHGWRLDPTPALRAYARLRRARLARLDPAAVQARLLRRLLRRAAGTRFGRAHGFDAIATPAEYAARVPLRGFDAFWQEWWQPSFPQLEDVSWPGRIGVFALTSGTATGRSKHIPYTPQMRRAAALGFFDLLAFHLAARPASRVLGGAALGLVGPTGLESRAPGVEAGAVSAITAAMAPRFLRGRLLPPPEIAAISDWGEKIRRLAPVALGADLRFLGGSPNWSLLFLREVARQAGGSTLADWFPRLELIAHGGVDFAPYRDSFAALLAGSRAETREAYSASEGFFAYADRGDGEGLRLLLDGGIFYEFVPLEELGRPQPRRDWIGTARTGIDYAMAISTAAGLWAYLPGDAVRFVTLDPPRILVRGRTSSSVSMIGEHLAEPDLVAAVAAAARAAGRSVTDFTVSGILQGGAGPRRHLVLAELDRLPGPAEAEAFAAALDRALIVRNDDYAELRENGYALAAPRVRFVPPGGFARWLGARAGGQAKVPRVISDPAILAGLERALGQMETEGGT
ncbi:GH3 auxin-responsive promoter family protein [Poseidonocella sp. HB161398]|uniref:GH3 family domain-containing protein n=1 Tax=Poseidonocella sp. HB161398 TaxID=2320855 RepID=UPI00148641FF|nr:GH3 auxin-responsive promoter family protein [Poseidonocella sp. HB161398]